MLLKQKLRSRAWMSFGSDCQRSMSGSLAMRSARTVSSKGSLPALKCLSTVSTQKSSCRLGPFEQGRRILSAAVMSQADERHIEGSRLRDGIPEGLVPEGRRGGGADVKPIFERDVDAGYLSGKENVPHPVRDMVRRVPRRLDDLDERPPRSILPLKEMLDSGTGAISP